MTELKPCPFCDSEDLTHYNAYVLCNACNANGPDSTAEVTSAAVWNKRAVIHEPPKFVCEVVSGCTNEAVYEGWYRKRDPCLGTPTGHLIHIAICEAHKTHPWLCANEPKKESTVAESE